MGRFVTNRDDVESQIRQDHWIVAFSKRELTETDALGALVAVGAAIYTDQPEIVAAYLDELLDESITGMEQAIEQTMATDLIDEIKNYAIPIIKNYLFGFSPGESSATFGHFGIKAGLAQFIGHNEEWNPVANPGDLFSGGDAGEWQQVGPGLVSYCPYVGIRFIQSGVSETPSVGGETTSPVGGWVILFGENGYWAKSVPDDVFQKVQELSNQGQTLKCVAFAPAGGWVILFGENGYWAKSVPDEAFQKVHELSNQGQTLKCVAFTPAGVSR
jgi:hypothetical protein